MEGFCSSFRPSTSPCTCTTALWARAEGSPRLAADPTAEASRERALPKCFASKAALAPQEKIEDSGSTDKETVKCDRRSATQVREDVFRNIPHRNILTYASRARMISQRSRNSHFLRFALGSSSEPNDAETRRRCRLGRSTARRSGRLNRPTETAAADLRPQKHSDFV